MLKAVMICAFVTLNGEERFTYCTPKSLHHESCEDNMVLSEVAKMRCNNFSIVIVFNFVFLKVNCFFEYKTEQTINILQ